MTPPPPVKVDYGLRLFHEVFKLEALHFGLFNDGEEPTLDNLRLAQRRYTDRLVELFPPGVTRVLDAGCGTGATGAILHQKGLQVECLTPDAYQVQVFRKLRGEAIPLHQARLQDFRPATPYDVVLMSESGQYVPTADLLAAAKRCGKPGGWLVMSDYFRKEPGAYYKTCHVMGDFLRAAQEAGLTLEHQEDVTERALPTLVVGKRIYTEYVLPVLEIVAGYIQDKAPVLKSVAELFLGGKIAKMKWYLYDKSEEKLDVDQFRARLNYVFLRFKLPG
jgi:2-polyprenyl-3-methyl-5-hydroxy-6-metoxy-1,4-benzoquinol methylase